MDAKTLFLERYHGVQEYPPALLRGLTDEEIRHAPHHALNPIAWLLWHIARCEDLGVNRLAVDRDQVFDDGWAERMDVSLREMGTGMTKSAVQDLSNRVVLAELLAYRLAVVARTESVVADMQPSDWFKKLPRETLERVFVEEGGVPSGTEWLVDAYERQTKGWLLGHIALTHCFYHLGQAFSVRNMHGYPSPW